MRLLALSVLLLAGAAADPDAPVRERIEAGQVARAEAMVPPGIGADRLQALAEAFYAAGTREATDAAERLFARALALREARERAEPLPLAALLHDLSGLHFNAGRFAKAEAAERRALAIRERVLGTDAPLAAQSRRDLGLIFLVQGRLAEAAATLPPAVQALEASGAGPEEVAAGRNYLAELQRLRGRYDDAERILRGLVDRPGAEADPQFPYYLNNLAGVCRDQGRFDEAEGLLRRSLALREAADPPDGGAVARATLNLAELMREQGKPAEAAPLYARALALARRALGEDSPELLEFVNQAAVLDREQGRLREAEAGFRRALALAESGPGPDHPRTAQTLLDLADTLRASGRCVEAGPLHARAVAIRERALGPEHPDVAEALVGAASCAAPAAARAALDRSIRILGRSEAHPAAAAEAYARRASLRRAADPAGARGDLEQALQVVERMRPHRGGGEDVRADFLGRHADLFARMARWEVEDGRPDRALLAVERGRARALLDQLAAARVLRAEALPAPVRERLAAARAELAEAGERLLFEQAREDLAPRERATRLAALEARRERAARAFREAHDEARNASPAWRAAAAGPPATLAEIRARVVPRDGRLLVYEVGREGSLLLAAAPGATAVEAFDLRAGPEEAAVLGLAPGPLTREGLERVLGGAGGLLAQVGSPAGRARGIGGLVAEASADRAARLHALWRTLLPAPLWAALRGSGEVLVIPDGPLAFLPFEMLAVAPGRDAASTRYWLDDGPVVRYAPSATLVRDLAARPAASGISGALSVSDPAFASLPRLPGTVAETEAVRRALAGTDEVAVLRGAEAREVAVRRALAGKRYVHLATHGLEDRLALAGGDLDLYEIYDLRVDAELAVLSACSTNTGRLVEGEGAFALSRGFLVAGARRVVASQWPVDDDSTAALVGELFRRLPGAGAATALRDAKRAVRGRPEWADPFHWAPFVLTGP